MLVVAGGIVALLIAGRRAGRSLLGEIWSKIGFLRWIVVLILIVVVVGITREYPGR
jgi:hypothetical protein